MMHYAFYDLGSSEMNLDMAIEMYEGQYEIVKINAPLVEGSFTAAVKLSTGGNMKEAIEEVNNTHFRVKLSFKYDIINITVK